MVDLEQKTKESNQNTVPMAATAEKPLPEKSPVPDSNLNVSDSTPKPHPKRAGRFAMFFTNYVLLHGVANSVLSLFIAYNIVTKEPVQKFMGALEKLAHPISKGWDFVTSPIRKGLEAIGLKSIDQELAKASEVERKAIHAERIMHGSRSFVETLCMCIAGSIILLPVKYLENHHTGFINAVDNFLHPSHKKQNDLEAKKQEQTGEKHNETWFNLIRARIVALIPIFWIDGIITNSSTKRFKEGKPNVDSWLWKKGAQLYENDESSRLVKAVNHVLPEDWTKGVTNFFARKKITLDGIQPMQLPKILHTIGAPPEMHAAAKKIADLSGKKKFHLDNPAEIAAIEAEMKSISKNLLVNHPGLKSNVEKVIFAEQARMFSKEIYLTAIYTVFLFVIGKVSFVKNALDKIGGVIGLSEKKHQDKPEPIQHTESSEPDTTKAKPETKQWSARSEKRDVKKEKAPAASYAEAAVNSQNQEAAVSL